MDHNAKPTKDETDTKKNPTRQANPERNQTQKPRVASERPLNPSFRVGVVLWISFRGVLARRFRLVLGLAPGWFGVGVQNFPSRVKLDPPKKKLIIMGVGGKQHSAL